MEEEGEEDEKVHDDVSFPYRWKYVAATESDYYRVGMALPTPGAAVEVPQKKIEATKEKKDSEVAPNPSDTSQRV